MKKNNYFEITQYFDDTEFIIVKLRNIFLGKGTYMAKCATRVFNAFG